MKILTSFSIAATLALGLASAAQAQSPRIPNPADPTPAYPIATDGSPLPRDFDSPVRTGRSAFAPVGDVILFVPNTIDTVVTGR